MSEPTGVHIVTLGCARNEVDSEELAGRLEAGGFRLVDDPAEADTVVVNTCGFIEQAKKDSIDTLLEAASLKEGGRVRSVVAVGCLAERYGAELQQALPEADAVLGFDSYPEMAARLRAILSGARPDSHVPRDRRALLPLTPVARPARAETLAVPGHAWLSGPRIVRRRLGAAPSAPLKIASGCDRRCAFCAIPSFRGAYLSRPSADLVAEARWLVDQGVKEVFLVSENTSSYGKDFGEAGALERLLEELSGVDGLEWIRVSYLQPAEVRPGLVEAMTSTDKVVPYFDLSFQHASPAVLRRMRRFGDPDSFLGLIGRIRALAPQAGIRSNVIAGFPGETEADVDTLAAFIEEARLDVLGVFGYSDEEGTEAAGLDGHLPSEEVELRRGRLADLAAEICDQRAADRIGERVEVLVETPEGEGRARHQAPETDGCTSLVGVPPTVGTIVSAVVIDSDGVDLIAEVS
ncbi:MAG: 30S ribosomal protein S12 methylthiotransferase RimO [Propionibacteriaceae bacterium]|nr:30S ribosomal protein S12 methylthiotransferase RimO [Propionibacteriaceae bacterium]